jgi:regulator of Ty1 transposition protein 109
MNTLLQELSLQIPESTTINLLYLTSQPIQIRPLTPIPRNQTRIPTTKIRHFFNILDATTNITIFGIEILVYLNIYPTHVDHYIFVSKCDTVGKTKPNFRVGDIVQCFLRYLAGIDLNSYNIRKPKEVKEETHVDNNLVKEYDIYQTVSLVGLAKIIKNLQDVEYYRVICNKGKVSGKESVDKELGKESGDTELGKESKESFSETSSKSTSKLNIPPVQHLKLCLFTKTSKQYLFPKSYKNAHKHVINGQQLLKWWIDVIGLSISKDSDSWKCKLLIPGSDRVSTQKFIEQKANWSIGHIFEDGKAVYRIPLFPDDPKGRFLEHLIVENRYRVVDVNGFYEELGFRQEFRLSDLVGLIGCETTKSTISDNVDSSSSTSIDSAKPTISDTGSSMNSATNSATSPTKSSTSTSTSHTTTHITPCTLSQYKQVLNILKNANYSMTEDIKSANKAVTTIFPSCYIKIIGKKAKSDLKTRSISTPQVNTLTVKRKPKDLNSLVRKKKRVEITLTEPK